LIGCKELLQSWNKSLLLKEKFGILPMRATQKFERHGFQSVPFAPPYQTRGGQPRGQSDAAEFAILFDYAVPDDFEGGFDHCWFDIFR
jgi:hypothetical protein